MDLRLVVLARWPAPGRCKRRLAVTCGPAAAAAVQGALTAHTLAVARQAAQHCGARLELVIDGLGSRARRRWARQLAVVHSSAQGGGGLGCRMQRQLRRAFTDGAERVVLIGTDLPGLERGDLVAAFSALMQRPLVLGPARDGGYWLIGFNREGFGRAGVQLMSGIPWGTEAVLPLTLARAESLSLPPLLLRDQSDLDRQADLHPLAAAADALRVSLSMEPALAVVIPALEEAARLPLVLADLAAAPPGLIAEQVVVDGGSRDGTDRLARLAGARLIRSAAGRGAQLQSGIAATSSPWLLLLHADARLQPGWAEAVIAAIASRSAAARPGDRAWCFDLAVAGAGLNLRLLELAVACRTRLRQLPYGDQGLLLPRRLLQACGGVRPLPLMEDLDLVLRLRQRAQLRSLGVPLRVDGRRWQRQGVLACAWRNARLRRAWRRGCPADTLARLYYGDRLDQGEYQKAQRRFWGSSSQP